MPSTSQTFNKSTKNTIETLGTLSKLDIALGVSIILMMLGSAYTLLAEHGGNASTAMMVISTLGMTGVAVLHSIRHLGAKTALIYFGIIVLIELFLEQVNIRTGGLVFGELTYPDKYFGPKIFDVPIAVPLAMCAINWPTYVLVNLILFRKIVVTSLDLTIPRAVMHCVILAVVHTAWSYCAEPMALSNEILFRPTSGDLSGVTHLGVPPVEFRGWGLMTFLQFFLFSFIIARFVSFPKSQPFNTLLDSAPLLMYGGTALMLLANPINNDMAIGIVFTMLTYVVLALFCMPKNGERVG